MLTNVWKEPGMIGWLALPVLCVGIYWIYSVLRRKTSSAEPPRKPEAEAPQPALSERERLTEEYCRVCCAVDAYRDRDVYRELFSRAGVLFQLLLGSRRRWLAEGGGEMLLQAVESAVKNLRLREQLTAEGFVTEPVPSGYDEGHLRRLCEKAQLSAIGAELEKQKRYLLQYQSYLDCKGILTDCGPVLYEILQDVQARNVGRCFEQVQQLEALLQDRGCYALFRDDSPVAESEALRIDFREDSPWATELPGLYTRHADGSYHRIGVLGGTVRRQQHGSDDKLE